MEGVTGSAAMVTKEATVNQEALNQAFFDSLVAGGASTEQISAMGLALGILNPQQADAIIRAYELEQGWIAIREALDAGEISADEARMALETLGENGPEDMQQLLDRMVLTEEEAAALEQKIIDIGNAIRGLPIEKQIAIEATFTGNAANDLLSGGGTVVPSGGGYIPPPGGAQQGGGRSNIPRALGGPVHAGISYLVGEQAPEIFVPNSGGRIVPASTTNHGDVTINIYPQTEMDVERAIDRGLERAGKKTNAIRRTI
jgi:hypothetical protein